MTLRTRLISLSVVIFFGALLAAGCSSSSPGSGSGSTVTSTATTAANAAPDFNVQTIMGPTVSLSDVKSDGKPILINFGASWCGPCNQEAPLLAQMYNKYKNRVTFLGMAVQDNPDDQRAFAKKYGLTYTIGLDNDGSVLNGYQQAGKVPYNGIPTTFFIGKKGNIVSFYVGPMTQGLFEQQISTILK